MLIGLFAFITGSGYSHYDAGGILREGNHYHEISTAQLHDLLYSGEDFIIVDARSPKFDDGNRIPGAKYLPHTTSEKEIVAALPNREQIVVVYCTGLKCPASKNLCEKLIKLNYTNVWRYSEGIDGWLAAGHPINKK